MTPPERLLVYEVSQGWAPLCAFLGLAGPDGPMPKVNSTEEFVGRVAHLPKSELLKALRLRCDAQNIHHDLAAR